MKKLINSTTCLSVFLLLFIGCEKTDPPEAAFDVSVETPLEGELIEFTDQSTNNPTSWHWAFGDGGSSTSQNPSYAYSVAGTYSVILRVENAAGEDRIEKTDLITVIPAVPRPIIEFTASNTSIFEGQTIQFYDMSLNLPTSWNWSFGDGDTSTEQDPEHRYTLPGSYSVSLSASNSYGTGEETRTDYIVVNEADAPPVAGFTCSSTRINEGETVQFTDLSGHYPSQWRWSFGDGGSSTLQNPEHLYEVEGIYFVSLSVHNSQGNGRITKAKYITVVGSGETIDSVADYDGNVYTTRKYGDQWWMTENLRAYRYPDGTDIPYVESETDWGALNITAEAFCYPFESYGLEHIYGLLYTWTTASQACPSGWHLPSDEEWIELEMYLGMSETEANSFNSRGTDEGSKLACLANLWQNGSLLSKSTFGSSGFMAFPAGTRDGEGGFIEPGANVAYWTSTKPEALEARTRAIVYDSPKIRRPYSGGTLKSGFSVRCVKD